MECEGGEWSVRVGNGVCEWGMECESGEWSVRVGNGV